MRKKDTENGFKHDENKPEYHLIPKGAIDAMGRVTIKAVESGKYPEHNWKTVPDGKKRYINAARRHILDYVEGEKYDNETGFNHLWHALTCLAFAVHLDK